MAEPKIPNMAASPNAVSNDDAGDSEDNYDDAIPPKTVSWSHTILRNLTTYMPFLLAQQMQFSWNNFMVPKGYVEWYVLRPNHSFSLYGSLVFFAVMYVLQAVAQWVLMRQVVADEKEESSLEKSGVVV